MDLIIGILKVAGYVSGGFIGIGLAIFFWTVLRGILKAKAITKLIGNQSSAVRKYFEAYNTQDAIAVIDETPRTLVIGEGSEARTFIIRPLKYRQVTRLCVLFAHTMDKMQGMQIDLKDNKGLMGAIVDNCEEDFFRALAIVLYYSQNPKEEDDAVVAEGVRDLFAWMKDNITLTQMTQALDIIIMQNDIHKAIESFGCYNLSGKKKVRE